MRCRRNRSSWRRFFFGRVFLHVAQAGEIVDHLAPGTRIGRGEVPALRHRPHLLEGQRIAFDRRRGVHRARPGILLQGGHPRHLDRRAQDALPQRRHAFHLRQQGGRDGELRFVAHGSKSSMGQVMSQGGITPGAAATDPHVTPRAASLRSGSPLSQFSGEGLVQQRLLQRRQRGLLPRVEGGEALGFFGQGVELSGDSPLLSQIVRK